MVFPYITRYGALFYGDKPLVKSLETFRIPPCGIIPRYFLTSGGYFDVQTMEFYETRTSIAGYFYDGIWWAHQDYLHMLSNEGKQQLMKLYYYERNPTIVGYFDIFRKGYAMYIDNEYTPGINQDLILQAKVITKEGYVLTGALDVYTIFGERLYMNKTRDYSSTSFHENSYSINDGTYMTLYDIWGNELDKTPIDGFMLYIKDNKWIRP